MPISKNSKFWELKRTTNLYELAKERKYVHEFSTSKPDENFVTETPSLRRRIQSLFGNRLSFSQQNIKQFESPLSSASVKSPSDAILLENDAQLKSNNSQENLKDYLTGKNPPLKSIDSSRKKLLNLESPTLTIPTRKSSFGGPLIQLQPLGEIIEEKSREKLKPLEDSSSKEELKEG